MSATRNKAIHNRYCVY